MRMGPSFIVLRVLLILAISVAQSLNIGIFEECYGSTRDNFLTASCDVGQVISIISLKAIAKRRDTKCPQEETFQTPLPSRSCCKYNESDCGDIYLGDGLAHYLSCNGRHHCIGIPIAWMDTPCKTGEYLPKTNYMRMEYECIRSSVTFDVTDNITTTNDEVHVLNPNYPDGNTLPPGGTVTCSVEASCNTSIVVTAVFLKFLEVSPGVCGQQMTIEDGMSKKEISCESNNNYNISDLYTSSSHFIKVKVNSSVASNKDWRFWFKFKGVNPDSQMTMACGSHSRNSAQNPSPGICTPMSTTPTLTTTPAPPSNSILDKTPNSTATCPGKLQDSYLKPSCDNYQVIAVDDLFVGSKPAAFMCPANLDIGVYNETLKQQCCTRHKNDCITQYFGDSRLSFFLSCNGRSRCDNSIPKTDTRPTACSAGGQYLANSNYMIMTYHCIDTGNIVQVGQDNSTKGDPLYISNDDFPLETNKSDTDKTCSIQAECSTRIRVVLVYLSLKYKGACQQKLTFTEENGNQTAIDCERNTESEVKDLFNSSTSFLLMTFANRLPGVGGKFWIEFTSSKKTFLTVSCGKEHSLRSVCLPTTQSPPTTATSKQSSTTVRTDSQNDTTTLIAILVPLAVILIIALVVCILCFCRENISRKCCGGQKTTVHPESMEAIFAVPVLERKTAPIATTFKADQRKSFIPQETTRSLSYSKGEESKGDLVQRKPQLRKYTSEMHLLKANGQKPLLQKRSFSSLDEKKSQLPAIFGTAHHAVDAELVEDEKAARKERKRRRKEKKRMKRESRRRLLEEEQQMNTMNYNGYAPNGSVTGPFRVAGHVANAFHHPVMRPYYPESGQENYYIPGHNMYDPQLPLAGSIYGYPASQHQNFQNIPVNGTASVRSASTPVSADGNSRDAYVPPASMAGSFRGTNTHPISMTGSFRGAPVQPSMSGSFRVPPIQRRPNLSGAPVSTDGGYYDEPITMGSGFHGGQISMDGTFRGATSTGSLRRHPSAMSVSQRAGEAPLIFHNGPSEGQFVSQGSMYEPYENPALSRWRMAATFATRPQTGGPTLEIGSVDNPNEREVNQVHDDSVV